MILRHYKQKDPPKEGNLKTIKHFAWFPKRIGNNLYWFQSYYKVYKYQSRQRYIYMIGFFKFPGWDLIEETVKLPAFSSEYTETETQLYEKQN